MNPPRFSFVSASLALVILFFPILMFSQPALDEPAKKKIIDEASHLLIENYVFPDVAEQCATHIQSKHEMGSFRKAGNPREFGELLTRELQSISHDKHMRVRAIPQPQTAGEKVDPLLRDYLARRGMAENNFGIRKIEILEGNVGYLDLRGFPPVAMAREAAVSAMRLLSNSDALIIDLRQNGGGDPATIQLICSYLFDKPTHLNSLYWRKGNRTEEFWTLQEIQGKRMPDVPLFVLTSHYTFSGGEEFAYNIKTQKRGTLIGEVTGGGANPGGGFPLGENMMIFIPTGRAINPITQTNWEGVGVQPDIIADSAKAFMMAKEKAQDAARTRRESLRKTMIETSREISEMLDACATLAEKATQEKIEKCVAAALDEKLAKGLIDEPAINNIGYKYLEGQRAAIAVAVFAYNVKCYPGSSNAYDSLGEAWMKIGEKDRAIASYKKSLDLDPDNDNARKMIEKMGESVK